MPAFVDKQFLRSLDGNDDLDIKKTVLEKWGRVEIVDACFKGLPSFAKAFILYSLSLTNIGTVIGETVVTPSSIVYLLVKLRISPPGATVEKRELSVEETKRLAQATAKEDEQFLSTREDAEGLDASSTNGYAHAPHWPGVSSSDDTFYKTYFLSLFIIFYKTRKPSWWIALADDKANRLVVPPLKISDIPYSRPDADRNYRAFKIQFQCPPNTGLFTWKIYIVSDTFAGEEAKIDITVSFFFVSRVLFDLVLTHTFISCFLIS